MKNNPVSRTEDIIVQELSGEVLIYDLKDNKAFCLNETSALIWEMCDGNKSVSEISRELGKKLNSPANEDLVWLALDQLKKEKLIESEVTAPSAYAGMNRRDVIRKIGLASMIALPVVAGLVAPPAAHAASCPPGKVPSGGSTSGQGADNASCVANADATCCSGTHTGGVAFGGTPGAVTCTETCA